MEKNFSPTKFLIPTGVGGLGIIPFAFFQYTTKHPKGLVALQHLEHGTYPIAQEVLYRGLEVVMVVMALLHFFFMVRYLMQFFQWKKSDGYRAMKDDPHTNAALMTPFLAGFMSFNVLIAQVRFFLPAMHDNLTTIIPYAFGAWAIVWAFALFTEMKLLSSAFKQKFDMNQLNFGWLMHSFALGMGTTVGSGIAVFAAKGGVIPDLAAMMSLVMALMGAFLFLVKTVSLFIGQYKREGLPGRQAMPTFLIVVPIITIYAITFYRLGHFLHKHHGVHVSGAFDWAILVGAWSFQVWYLMFGLALLKNYLKEHFTREYYLSQWGLICPFAGFAVLSSLVTSQVPALATPISVVAIITMIGGIVLYFDLLVRHNKCKIGTSSVQCQ